MNSLVYGKLREGLGTYLFSNQAVPPHYSGILFPQTVLPYCPWLYYLHIVLTSDLKTVRKLEKVLQNIEKVLKNTKITLLV